MMETKRRPSNQTPNREPFIWEIWNLDLEKVRAANPELDIDPDKLYRPYLVYSNSGYILKTGNVTCFPINGYDYYPAFEVKVQQSNLNGLTKDSHIHCHAIQTLERNFLTERLGVLDDIYRKQVKNALVAFLNQP